MPVAPDIADRLSARHLREKARGDNAEVQETLTKMLLLRAVGGM
jgi:hypothetical protein